MLIHSTVPPGVDTMKRLRNQIDYSVEIAPRGAQLRITTLYPEALVAIHDFLRFQDHRSSHERFPTNSGIPALAQIMLAISIRRLLLLTVRITGLVLALAALRATAGEGQVFVLYAGSLGNLMEKDVGPAFSQATGYKYLGEAKGSMLCAHMIKDKLRTPEVFISADPKVNDLLMGAENGNIVHWYVTVFGNEMVLGYNPNSSFAGELKQVAANDPHLYQILQEKGFRLGRGDPELEPKGYRTLFLFDLAEKYYGQPGLAKKILADPERPTQVFPEEQLVARLEAGQVDAGIFYRNEVAEHNLPFITFPREINLGDPALDPQYGATTYVSPKGPTYHGASIVYSVTIPETAQNREGAIALVGFLLSAEGRKILEKHHFRYIEPLVSGDIGAVPGQLQTALKQVGSQ
jgi:molybdate/tungstate transport system substrate-binding protein